MRAVLTFHGIDDADDPLSYRPRSFVQLVHGLLRRGVPIVTFDRLLSLRHGVTLTFDDGLASVHRSALPVLREAGVPAHLFVVPGRVGRDDAWAGAARQHGPRPLMGWDELAECASAGLSIENHTATHVDLRGLDADAVLEQCSEADEVIERRTLTRPRYLAYPYGAFSDIAKRVARQRYVAAFTTRLRYFDEGVDMHAVPRIGSHYFGRPSVRDNLLEPVGRAYVAARGLVRELREVTA